MQKKREVCLYGLEQLALIIKSKSGVYYFNQAGGYSCLPSGKLRDWLEKPSKK